MSAATEVKPRRDEVVPWERWAPPLAGGALVLALGLCLVAAQRLGYLWRSSEFYAHAYAVPVVAAYLAYGRRREITAALWSLRPPLLGPLVTFGAALFLVLAVMGDIGVGAGLGIPIVLGATLYAMGGRALLRPLLLSLTFLLLMIPPPGIVRNEVLVDLKLLVTKVAVTLLQGGGATVLAEGNTILLPQGTLFVADACSGFTSIVTLLPISCIVAYFLSRGLWRRLVIVASVVPLSIAANVLRITITVLLASRLGIEVAQGSLHQTFGLATYVFGTLAVVAVARLVR